jgi:hypothetical protein
MVKKLIQWAGEELICTQKKRRNDKNSSSKTLSLHSYIHIQIELCVFAFWTKDLQTQPKPCGQRLRNLA